jgi:hypothetical protein
LASYRDYVRAVSAKRQSIALNQVIDLGGNCYAVCVLVNGQSAGGLVNAAGDENASSIGLVVRCD